MSEEKKLKERKIHGTAKEAADSFDEAVTEALSTHCWMGVIFCVKDGHVRLEGMTTWKFPTGDFEMVLRMLKERCDEEKAVSDQSNPPPLKRVNPFAFHKPGVEEPREELKEEPKE